MTRISFATALLVVSVGLAACNPPPQAGFHQPMVATPPPLGANTGPTMAEAGPTPPAFDHNGNANYDSSGAYIGGHGIGTTVDSPEDPTKSMIPKIDAPDMSSMHCAGSQGANAGVMNCSSN